MAICLKHNFVEVPAGMGKSYLVCRNVGCKKRKAKPKPKPKK